MWPGDANGRNDNGEKETAALTGSFLMLFLKLTEPDFALGQRRRRLSLPISRQVTHK
jgi:hypothetical protein